CARVLRAWLDPLAPALRSARRDTGLPSAASLRAIWWAWFICGCAAGGAGRVVLARGPCGPGQGTGPGRRLMACGLVPARSCLVLGGPCGGPGDGWSCGPAAGRVCGCCVGV